MGVLNQHLNNKSLKHPSEFSFFSKLKKLHLLAENTKIWLFHTQIYSCLWETNHTPTGPLLFDSESAPENPTSSDNQVPIAYVNAVCMGSKRSLQIKKTILVCVHSENQFWGLRNLIQYLY